MTSSWKILTFLILVFFCASCLAKTSTPEITSGPKDETQEPYPYPVSGSNPSLADLPYPMNSPTYSIEANLPPSLTIPEPGPETGIVIGFLVTASKEPYIGSVYLAKAIPASQPDIPPLVAFSDQTDPKALQDANGQFLFTKILPGEYALALWNPVSNLIIHEPGTENFFLFKVEAGKVTDLGEVVVP